MLSSQRQLQDLQDSSSLHAGQCSYMNAGMILHSLVKSSDVCPSLCLSSWLPGWGLAGCLSVCGPVSFCYGLCAEIARREKRQVPPSTVLGLASLGIHFP
jgi:hypothetical protein